MTLKELCKKLSISEATGRNWLRLGKITPDNREVNGEPSFSKEYVDSLVRDIASGKIQALNSRRNKKFVSGSFFYNSYVPKDSDCLPKVRAISEYIEENDISLSDSDVCLVLAYYAAQLFDYNECDSNRSVTDHGSENADISGLITELARSYQGSNNLLLSDGSSLITDISTLRDRLPDLFSQSFVYEPGTDTLGLLYMSLKDLGSRKNAGSYYTPTEIVKKSIDNLDIHAGQNQINREFVQDRLNSSLTQAHTNSDLTVLDPCCGSGNFLIQMPDGLEPSGIYGCDIDRTCVCITRIGLALKYGVSNIPVIRRNIRCANFLTSSLSDIFGDPSFSPSYIIGNPPWGYDFDDEEKKNFKSLYATAKGKAVESFDLFTEKGISELNARGHLSFVLPEAALSVNIHKALRNIIISSCNITYLAYLGDVFHKVACPSVILQLAKTGQKLDTFGMIVENMADSSKKSASEQGTAKNKTNAPNAFIIQTHRSVSSDKLSFYTNDEEYSILETMSSSKESVTLKGKAVFALGIVTGNNDKYIIDMPGDGYEIILKGSDISKYHIAKPQRYINFTPENFQQVAKTEIYRAKEKLFYRFINNELTFAYDDEGLLSLNSCNILIPQIPDLNIKYVMAVLNSSPAQFFFKNSFNSVKVLRSHLEQIPIPVVSKDEQEKIAGIVDTIIKESNSLPKESDSISNSDITSLPAYEQLDNLIAKAYGLTDSQYMLIHDKIM